MLKLTLMTGTALLGFASSAPGLAQDSDAADASVQENTAQAPVDDPAQLEEIIVTAQRREERVQDIPIAISAFTSQELATRGVTNALEVTQFVPNLVGLNNTGLGTANAYYLRGLGSSETIATFDPPVGTYVDEIYLSRQNANNLSLFDVERVEVLRGPQGTLFGRNTTGGAINLILREPGKDVRGYAEVGYGSYRTKVGRASIDVPFNESLAVKLSGFWQDDRGYVKNTTTGERLNDSDGWGLRLGVRAELGAAARWIGSYTRVNADGENILNVDCDPSDATNCDGRFATTGLTERGRPFENLMVNRKRNYGLGNRTDTDILSSNFQFGESSLRLNVITGYVNLVQRYALDFSDGHGFPSISDPRPAPVGFTRGGFSIVNDGVAEQFTQEIKLTGQLFDGAVDFVAGAYYFREDNKTDFGDVFSLGFLPGFPPPDGFALLLADRILRNSTDAKAGYAQGDFNVTDQIKLTAGVRYTDETKKFSVSDNRPVVGAMGGLTTCFGPGQFAPSPCLSNENLSVSGRPIPRRQNVKIWTPRFAATYEPNESLLFFGSATRGFKSGGWNARGTSPDQLLPFGPEKVWSYEAGFKSELFKRRLRVNVTAYLADVAGLQVPAAINTATGVTFITRNFTDYQNKGLEIELTARPFAGLNLFAAAGLQDDKYKLRKNAPASDEFGVQSVAAQLAACRTQLAAGLVPNGDATSCGVGIVSPLGELAEPVRTPDFTVALGGSYDARLGTGGLTLSPSVNANFRSRSEVGPSSLSIYSGSITSSSGTVYPANPYRGDFITGSFSPSRWIVNGGLTLRGASDTWSLGVECKNCFDKEVNESSLAELSYFNPPRTWLLKSRIEF